MLRFVFMLKRTRYTMNDFKQDEETMNGLKDTLQELLKQLEKDYELHREKITPTFPCDKRTNTIRLPASVEKEICNLAAKGEEIEAIKRVSRLTGAGLRLSKDYVDKFRGQEEVEARRH
jgi:ribosomal protein L7/L12